MKLNIMMSNRTTKEVDGYLIKNTPIKCFAHKDDTYEDNPTLWVVSEFFSGMHIGSRKRTRKEAIESAMMTFEEKTLDEIKQQVNKMVKQYGFANKDGTEKKLRQKINTTKE